MFELIVNILLFIGIGYSYMFHAVEAPIPDRVLRNPRALNPDIWPKGIMILLLICLFFNIIRLFISKRKDPDFSISAFIKSVGEFFASKLFIGIIFLVVCCFALEPLGFMPTCLMMLICYGILLGDRKYVRLVILAVLITILLYVLFNGFLAVNLPRGTILPLRNFSLQVEMLLDKVTSMF